MREEILKIYKFDELSDEAKEKALDECRYFQVEDDWWDSMYEDAANIGLKITGFGLDRNRHADGEFLLAANEVAANILSNHGDMCETYKTAENFMAEWEPIFNDYMDENSENYESSELEDKMNDIEDDFLKSLLEDYSIILQNECEYLQSDESVKEMIEANDYEFTEYGEFH